MSSFKIGLITTLGSNIGDDFIRSGICNVLKEVYKNEQIEFVCVNKHTPYTIYPPWHPVHLRKIAERLPVSRLRIKESIETYFPRIGFSRFDRCKLLVQCGAPVFWPDCSHNEWSVPIWHEVVGRLYNTIPVLNLAAGSCYPWERQPERPEAPEDMEYIASILGYCRLTTVRDRLAKDICSSVGRDVPLLPCTAFLAAYGHHAEVDESGYILINYMAGGGHYAWEQGIDAGHWENTIQHIIINLGKRHKLAFLCHDEKEYLLAQEFNVDIPVFFPKSPTEYFNCVSRAKFGICNRMHASVGMAGMGIPSIAVCTDTRLLMVAELGLPVYYVKDVDAAILEEEVERLLTSLEVEKERLLALQERTRTMYLSAIRNTLFSS